MYRQRGLTLVEMMIVFSIVVVMITIAAPGFGRLIAGQRISTVRDSLFSAIQYAKSQAVHRNVSMSLCPSLDGVSCYSSTNWAQGWLVYIDALPVGWGVGDVVLRAWPGSESVDQGAVGTLGLIRFRPQGTASHGANQTIGFCDPARRVLGRSLVIATSTGQVRNGSAEEAGC